jgi:hypothetical protein
MLQDIIGKQIKVTNPKVSDVIAGECGTLYAILPDNMVMIRMYKDHQIHYCKVRIDEITFLEQ